MASLFHVWKSSYTLEAQKWNQDQIFFPWVNFLEKFILFRGVLHPGWIQLTRKVFFNSYCKIFCISSNWKETTKEELILWASFYFSNFGNLCISIYLFCNLIHYFYTNIEERFVALAEYFFRWFLFSFRKLCFLCGSSKNSSTNSRFF